MNDKIENIRAAIKRVIPIRLLLFFCVSIPVLLSAQDITLMVNTSSATNTLWLDLLKPIAEIRENTLVNESLIDLVDVYLTDSILTTESERHHFVGSALVRMLGNNWRTINWRKEKYVGTAHNGFEIHHALTENDVNVNVTPHLKRYIDLAYEGYQKQKEIGRWKRKIDYEATPFVYPAAKGDLNQYHVKCELTPLKSYRTQLNDLFYPAISSDCKTHHCFGNEHPVMGVYGAFVSDCNHDCHPEIHPYEWIWWLNVNPLLDEDPDSKTWLFGIFREGSDRMPNWSPKPRTGEISIPFVFPADKKELQIQLDNLVFGAFNEGGFAQLTQVPADAVKMDKPESKFLVKGLAEDVYIIFKTDSVINSNAIKFWFSSLNYDKERNLLSGKLHVALSVDDLYTAKVKFSY